MFCNTSQSPFQSDTSACEGIGSQNNQGLMKSISFIIQDLIRDPEVRLGLGKDL